MAEEEKKVTKEKKELTAGDVLDKTMHIAYLFYFAAALVGLAAYLIKQDKVLYIVTAVIVVTYLLQFLIGWMYFRLGILLIPLGAGLGVYFIGGFRGGALGILIVFITRHILREILWKAIYRIFDK